MQLKIFYDHGQTFKTVRFEDSITVQEAIRRFAERTPLYTSADPSLYGFYLPDSYPYLSSYPSPTSPPPLFAPPSSSPAPSPPNPSPPVSSQLTSPTGAPVSVAGSDDMDGVGWLENDRLLASYHIKDFLLFKKKTSSYPRKITSNFTLTRIHLPTSDKTLKYDSKMTVKEAIHYLKSRNPGVDMANYGLFLLYSPLDSDGFFMDEDRTISSYDLDYQAELHFTPKDKKVSLSDFTILFPKKQVRKKTQYNTDTTLQQLVEKACLQDPSLGPSPPVASASSPSPSPSTNSSSSSSSSVSFEKYGYFIPPYDDGDGKYVEGDTSMLNVVPGNYPFAVYQPVKEKADEEAIVQGEMEVEVHIVAPTSGNLHVYHRRTIWASKTGVSVKVRVDEETTVHELKETVKKVLLGQRAQWASVISEWGVYFPHQTDGESLLDDDTPIISIPIAPGGRQFEIKPLKRAESFSADMSPGLQVIVHQYNTRAQNKLTIPADKYVTIGILKEQIFEMMGNRLTKEQAFDYVLSKPCIFDDGEYFDDDARDLNSYKIDVKTVLEFKPRPQYPPADPPLLILSVLLNPSHPPLPPLYARDTDIHLRLPVYTRALKVCEVLTQLYGMICNTGNPKLEQTIKEFKHYSLYWKDRNLWLSPTRSVISYGIPAQHTIQLEVKPVGIHLKLWNYQLPQTLGYFTFPPDTLVSDLDKKDLFSLVRLEHHASQEKFSRNRTVSITAPIPQSPKKLPPTSPTDKFSVIMDVDLDPDIYGFYCIPEQKIGDSDYPAEKPYWLDTTKTLKQNGLVEGSVIELKPMPQPLNVVYPDPLGGRTSVTVQFDMDKPIAGYLPIPLEKNDRVIWQKEPHNPSGFLLDPTQSLSAQGIRPYYGASILLTRFTQKKEKHEDNSIEGQISRDLWEELRAAEPEGLVLNAEGLVQAGTVNRLIEHLTNSKVHDLAFMKTFLLTYQAFLTPRIFFSKLVKRYLFFFFPLSIIVILTVLKYHVPAPPDTTDIGNFVENVQRPIQLRVCNVLKKMIDISFHEFDHDLLMEMSQFTETVLIPSGNAGLAQKIHNSLLKNMQAISKPKINLTFGQSPPISRLAVNSATKNLMDFDELEIARQLTILEYETYAAIEPTELLNQAWCKPKLMDRAPNILKMIARFNGISSWVTGALIDPEEIKQRVKAFKKVVTIGKHLLELNSLNALMAIIAGWNNSGVLRLKYTIKELPKKTQEDMAHLETLMNSEGSYKKYRAYLHNANPPQIPYIGIYLSDLTFIEEGNDDTIRGLVNFEKMRLSCNVILELQQYQQQPYNLTRIPELSDLLQKELTASANVDEGTRYQKSLQREPRGAARDDIR